MADLSPAAQAVLDALNRAPADTRLMAAAALRAAADQAVPVEVPLIRSMRPFGYASLTADEIKQEQRQQTRRRLLAIADELESRPQPTP